MIIREAIALDSAAIARVHVESWRSTYGGQIDQHYLDRLSVDHKTAWWLAWFEHRTSDSFARVAVTDGPEVVGFAMAGSARGNAVPALGELFLLYLLDPYRRRGIGSRLLESVARGLDRRGMTSLLVWVLATNHARDFYRDLGARELTSRKTSVGAQPLTEVAYLWADLSPLLRGRTAA